MADQTAEITYNISGQIVETYPPEMDEGPPSSATCSVFDGDRSLDDTADFSPTVTVDAASLTVSSSSGYSQTNRRKVNFSSTTGLAIGRLYRLLNADSQWEIARCTRIVTNSYIEVEDDLKYDYGTTATLKGLRMTFTVDATWVATEANILPPTTVAYPSGNVAIMWAQENSEAANLTMLANSHMRAERIA
mgnify:CR=1 FL=1